MYPDESYDLRVEIDTENCEISPFDEEKMQRDFEHLARLIENFPVADLHVRIVGHPRSNDYHVKTSLKLPGRTIFTGERHELLYTAFNRCARKLEQKVKTYKAKLGQAPERERAVEGKVHDVRPQQEPDANAIEEAVATRDFERFRDALSVYDDSLDLRIGRLIERYPEIAAELGETITISDIREEVYLNAFESFDVRPADRLGNWLEGLIEPSLRAVVDRPAITREEVEYSREIRGATDGTEGRA